MYPVFFKCHTKYMDKIMGTSEVREALEKGIDIKDIVKSHQEDLNNFYMLRKSYLLY